MRSRARLVVSLSMALAAAACHPGANPTVSPPPASSPSPVPQRWAGTMRSSTFHDLYVGGRCTSAYATTLGFVVAADGSVSGRGRARLSGGPACAFPLAQLQVKTFWLKVTGRLVGGRFELRLVEVGQSPSAGAIDYGGFLQTVLGKGPASTLKMPVLGARTAGASLKLAVPGPDRDTFGSVNVIRLRCGNCGG